MEGDFRVGEWLVRPETGAIKRGDQRVTLEPKVMEVLVHLAKHAGKVLPKERIIQAVWLDTFVTDEVLTNAISELRKALGDDARNPDFIQTHPKRGYRLIAPVSKSEPASRSRPRRVWIGAAALIVVTGVYLYFWTPSPREMPELTPVPLTSYLGSEREPSFSPDGEQVAFSWNGEREDNFDIYVVLVGSSGPPDRLTDHPARDFGPAWSPDGHRIAFLRELPDGMASVRLVSARGGPEQELVQILMPVPSPDGRSGGLAWSPDSQRLAMSHKISPQEPSSLSLISIKTRESHPLTSPLPLSGRDGDRYSAFSPDGRKLAFTRKVSTGSADLYLLALSETGTPEGERRLTFENWGPETCSWTPDGRHIVFDSFREGDLWRIGVSESSKPQRLALGEDASNPAISRQKSRLVYERDVTDINIWRLDLVSESESGPPARFISSTRYDGWPQYSPDGSKIAFNSNRSGRLGSREIWVCDSDGSNLLLLTSVGGALVGSPHWSPDGKQIVFDSRVAETSDIYVIAAKGGVPRRVTDHPSNDLLPSWSRDGNWIYFGSDRSGEHQVWKISPDGEDAEQVTDTGGLYAVESPDGRFLYFTKKRRDTPLFRTPVRGGKEEQILDSLNWYASFAVRDDGVYFVRKADASGHRTIEFYDFAEQASTLILKVDRPMYAPLAISPDGRSLLYTQIDVQGFDLMLVENFH